MKLTDVYIEMRILNLAGLALVLVCACTKEHVAPSASSSSSAASSSSSAPSGEADADTAPDTDLVFEGTVVDVAPVRSARDAFRVTMAVEKVVRGSFSGARFEFGVHSPTKSGLVQGGRYTVRATREKDGYVVDPAQWRLKK